MAVKRAEPAAVLVLLLLLETALSIPDSFEYLLNIDSSIKIYPRYAQKVNFVGEVIDGYRTSTVVITKEAGKALSQVQKTLKQQGYSLLVYDAYRPQKAVDHFVRWSQAPGDSIFKQFFYPFIDKSQIIPSGYVASKSGHSRGSTVDLTIIPLNTEIHELKVIKTTLLNGQKVLYLDDGSEFMCSHFDFFGGPSHQDSPLVLRECLDKRDLLRGVMKENGFRELFQEWWHYTLADEPFPDTYFDFDIV